MRRSRKRPWGRRPAGRAGSASVSGRPPVPLPVPVWGRGRGRGRRRDGGGRGLRRVPEAVPVGDEGVGGRRPVPRSRRGHLAGRGGDGHRRRSGDRGGGGYRGGGSGQGGSRDRGGGGHRRGGRNRGKGGYRGGSSNWGGDGGGGRGGPGGGGGEVARERFEVGEQGAEVGVLEERHRVDVEPVGGQCRGQLDGHHRVQAQLQQVVLGGHAVDEQDLADRPGERRPQSGGGRGSGHGYFPRFRGGGQNVVRGWPGQGRAEQVDAVVLGEGRDAVGGGLGGDGLAHADGPQAPAEAVPGPALGALAGGVAVQVGVGRGVGALAEVGPYRRDRGEQGDERGPFVPGDQVGERVRSPILGPSTASTCSGVRPRASPSRSTPAPWNTPS